MLFCELRCVVLLKPFSWQSDIDMSMSCILSRQLIALIYDGGSVSGTSVYESGFRSLLALFRNRGHIRSWQDEIVRLLSLLAFLVPFFRQTTSVYWHFVSIRCAA